MNELFKKTSDLTAEEIQTIRRLLSGKQPFSIYFNAALDDLQHGLDNRSFHLNSEQGVAMGIDFDGLRIFSIVGKVGDEAVAVITADARRTEFHVTPEYADLIVKLAGSRITRKAQLKYYVLHRTDPYVLPPHDVRLLTPTDLPLVQRFYAQNYDATIFSAWMLEQPFVGLFANDTLVSAGGTIVMDKIDRAANVGNFLTAPAYRGRGHVQTVAKVLINELLRLGFSTFTLGTTEENVAAWQAWEAVGFRLLERRIEIETRAGI